MESILSWGRGKPPPSHCQRTAHKPPTTLHVIDTPLEASHAGAFLVGTPSCSSHHDLTPSTRLRHGRGGRLCCGCLLAYRSCVLTPDSRSDPQRSSPPCRRLSACPGSCLKRTDKEGIRVQHPTDAAYLPTSTSHHMQLLMSFKTPKFRSEGRRRLRPRSRSGARPLPLSHAWVRDGPSVTSILAHARNTSTQ